MLTLLPPLLLLKRGTHVGVGGVGHRHGLAVVPNLLGTRDHFCGTVFPRTEGWGSFWMIQTYYIYCGLYFCYYYISSTSDHQALDPGDWEPLV